jgi:DNA-binding NarL/FixJ family response regulator
LVAQSLADRADLAVVGVVATVVEGLRLVDESGADVLLLDLELLDGPASDALAAAERSNVPAHVVVLVHGDGPHVVPRGATSWISKRLPLTQLADAIRSLDEETRHASRLPTARPAPIDESRKWRSGSAGLTALERAVLVGLARGLPERDVAEFVGVSRKTVASERARLARKLGCAADELPHVAVGREQRDA